MYDEVKGILDKKATLTLAHWRAEKEAAVKKAVAKRKSDISSLVEDPKETTAKAHVAVDYNEILDQKVQETEGKVKNSNLRVNHTMGQKF